MTSHLSRKQSGFILLFVLTLLAMLMFASLYFMNRNKENINLVGHQRNASASLLMAESAMNKLLGDFSYGADLNNDGDADNGLIINPQNVGETVPYLYFRSDSRAISQSQPSILQAVANSEGRGNSASINDNNIPLSTEPGIADLLTTNHQPVLYKIQQGELFKSTQAWNDIAGDKAAAWLEITLAPQQQDSLLIFVQAVAQTGSSKSYVQRYAGHFSERLGRLSALSEANPNPNAAALQRLRPTQ